MSTNVQQKFEGSLATDKPRMKAKRRQYKNYYLNKRRAVVMLSNLDRKKITDDDFRRIAKTCEMPVQALKLGWKTFLETGGKTVDRKTTSGKGSIKMNDNHPQKYGFHKTNDIELAGEIIREYMTTDINSRDLCNKYEIGVWQFYEWIRELSVSGELMGYRVLDPKKYYKPEIKDVIWMHKNPNTTRKSITDLTSLQKANYKRVATVLLKYLPSK